MVKEKKMRAKHPPGNYKIHYQVPQKQCCGSGLPKISQNHGKFLRKSTKIIRISYIFFKTFKLMFTDINIYPINNKTDHILGEIYFFYRKKSKTKVDIFRIHFKIKRIRNTAQKEY